MQVTQNKKEAFRPITIVLETETEAEALMSICGAVYGSRNERRNATDSIYNALESMDIKCRIMNGGGSEFPD